MKNQYNIHEVQIKYSRPQINQMRQVFKSHDAATLFKLFADADRIDHKEFFWVMLLSQAHHVLGIGEISVGTTNAIAVNTKEIFQLALKGNASNLILGHNHPSGNGEPSSQDISLTNDLVKFGRLMGIEIKVKTKFIYANTFGYKTTFILIKNSSRSFTFFS